VLEGAAADVGRLVHRALHHRQPLQQVDRRRGARPFDVLAPDHLHRQRGLGVDAADRRAGDLDPLRLLRGGRQRADRGGDRGGGERQPMGAMKHGPAPCGIEVRASLGA
jgi:hypothetical protein